MPSFPAGPEFPRPTAATSRFATCCSQAERCCWVIATWLPICIIYGATTWAIYVNAYLISFSFVKGIQGTFLAILGVSLYSLCLWSYSIACFTDPGSPIDADKGYSYLPQWQPTHNPSYEANVTVKNDGRARYCQKCNYTKPDRTHHCSICKRCILKMDHHCPWLGNCIGFHNYKAFVLFLIYISVFCFECCVLSGFNVWYWAKYVSPNADYLPIQWILLAVISGVVSLCVGGFTIWHIIHVFQNVTTIEALEKTRYIHTLPSTALHAHGHRRSSNDTPNAFDIGRRANWEQVMGPDPLKWFLPLRNSVGNGLAFPLNEDVKGILRGMRRGGGLEPGSAVDDEEEEDNREYRRGSDGRWMMHD